MIRIKKRADGSIDAETVNEEKSLTNQSFAADADINNIVKKYMVTGELPVHQKQAQFADISTISDYHESLNKVIKANDAFDALPADIRTRFEHDPAKLIDFLNDPKNIDEGVKLGIYDKQKQIDAHKNDKPNNEPIATNPIPPVDPKKPSA